MIVEQAIVQVKQWREQLRMILADIQNSRLENGSSYEKQQVMDKVIEARGWLAEELFNLEQMPPSLQESYPRRIKVTTQADSV